MLWAVAAAASRITLTPALVVAPLGLGDLETRADDVTLDAEHGTVELRGAVRVEASPFHLRAEALTLRRTPQGIRIEGEGKLAFCPCLGTPLTVTFKDALVAPPSDLVLESPRLEIYSVPVLVLPYFWLRGAERPGLLPPTVAYRGKDGLFAAIGAHVPWSSPARGAAVTPAHRELGLDVRAGGYVRGGAAVDVDLRTPSSRTLLRGDWLDVAGLSVDARGSHGPAVWDVAAVRGARGLAATTSLDEAARPLDRARGELSFREGALAAATAVELWQRRGPGETAAIGPSAGLRVAESLGRHGHVSAALRGGAMRDADAGSATSYAVGEAGGMVGAPVGLVGLRADVSGEGGLASEGRDAVRYGTGGVEVAAGLPLVRAFASDDSSDPLRHRLEPYVAGAAVGTVGDAPGVGFAALRAPPALAPSSSSVDGAPLVGLRSALARYGTGVGVEGDLSAGYALDHAAPFARWRVVAGAHALGFSVAGGAAPRVGAQGADGAAGTARLRVGPRERLHLEARGAARFGAEPALARLFTGGTRDAARAPLFARDGASAGAGIVVPWTRHFTTRAAGDVDLTARELLGVTGSADLRDGCGCVTLRVLGSHRLGREGVDVWLALEVGDWPAAPVR